MEEWKLTKIGSLCKRVCSGGTPKSTIEEYFGGGIPQLNTKEVNFNRIYSTESTISDAGLNNSSAKWIDKHSVIVAMYGATAAKCAIGMIPMTTNQACCNLMVDENLADYRFIYYALTNSILRDTSLARRAGLRCIYKRHSSSSDRKRIVRRRLSITPDCRKTLVFSQKSQETCLQGSPPVHGRRPLCSSRQCKSPPSNVNVLSEGRQSASANSDSSISIKPRFATIPAPVIRCLINDF